MWHWGWGKQCSNRVGMGMNFFTCVILYDKHARWNILDFSLSLISQYKQTGFECGWNVKHCDLPTLAYDQWQFLQLSQHGISPPASHSPDTSHSHAPAHASHHAISTNTSQTLTNSSIVLLCFLHSGKCTSTVGGAVGWLQLKCNCFVSVLGRREMTSYRFSRQQPWQHNTTSGFE